MISAEYAQLIDFLGRQFTAIDQRFAALEDRIDDLRREMLGHFEELYRRLERVEQEYQAVVQALRRIEASLADDRGRRAILERDVAALKEDRSAAVADPGHRAAPPPGLIPHAWAISLTFDRLLERR